MNIWKRIRNNPLDAFYYLQGNYRYKLYYSKLRFLLRKHIREQIKFRIRIMDKECYDNGECKMCGCKTTALQMANKACDKPCYPPMMNSKEWEGFTQAYRLSIIIGYCSNKQELSNLVYNFTKYNKVYELHSYITKYFSE